MSQHSTIAGLVSWRTIIAFIILISVSVGVSKEVQTKFGTVRGVWSRSSKGRLAACYLGLPYAEPPIGDLRFRAPQPWSRKWNITYDATKDGSKCLQLNRDGQAEGSEDCLFLNICAPVFTDKWRRRKRLPVLVFVHGGKFAYGSGNSRSFSSGHMMDQDLVLVTLNYRLNIMGFYTTESKTAAGNYGLKDVQMALRWVQENIEAFHGDPNSVTLWGHSAGASAAHLLSFSKKTEGLFHRYIISSGSVFASWTVNPSNWIRKASLEAADLFDCLPQGLGNNSVRLSEKELSLEEKMLDCMRSRDAKSLVGVIEHFNVWAGNPCCAFGPVMEEESEEAVITVDPMITLKTRQFRDIPCIVGVVRDEGLVKTIDIVDRLDEIKKNFKEYILILTEMHLSQLDKDEFIRAATEFYFASNVSALAMDKLTELVGDAIIIWPTYQVMRHQSPVMKSSVYFYFFTYKGTFSNSVGFSNGKPIYYGIMHGDEINYLLPNLKRNSSAPRASENDVIVSNIMSDWWGSFVATGVPNSSRTIPWPDTKNPYEYMLIGEEEKPEMTVDNNFLPARMAFWMEMTDITDEVDEIEAEVEVELLLPSLEAVGSSSTRDNANFLVFLLIPLTIFR